MSEVDYAVFLVAGALGVFLEPRVGFGVIAIWALLKLLNVV